MIHSRSMHELRYFVNSKGNIRPSNRSVLQGANNTTKQRGVLKRVTVTQRKGWGGSHRCSTGFGISHFGKRKQISNVLWLRKVKASAGRVDLYAKEKVKRSQILEGKLLLQRGNAL